MLIIASKTYSTIWPVCLRIAFTYLFAKIVNSQGIFSLFQPRCSSNFCILKPELITEFMISLRDRKSTRLNSSHVSISYAVFCLKKKKDRLKGTELTSWAVRLHAIE